MIHSHPDAKRTLDTNLKKVEWMTRKIESMINENAYCGDIIQQINATMGLLKKMNHTLLKSHLLTCGNKKLATGSDTEKEVFVDEILRLMNKG